MGVEVVHHDVEPDGDGVAGAEPREDGEEVIDRLALPHLADETVGMDVIEGKELFRAFIAVVGCPEPLRMPDRCPAATGQRSQFERAALVEADDRAVVGAALVEVEDAVFFTSNSGSGDCFQVLVCW